MFCDERLGERGDILRCLLFYLVRNNAPLLPPGQAPPRKGSCPGGRPSGPVGAAGLDFRIIPAGFNPPLEFLTGFTICLVVFGVCLTYAKSCSLRRARVVAACDCARCYAWVLIPNHVLC